MKQVKVLTLALLVLAAGFILKDSHENSTLKTQFYTLSDGQFILGAMNTYRDNTRDTISHPDKFAMNIWHRYTDGSYYESSINKLTPKGWFDGDVVFTDDSYKQRAKDTLEVNENHNLKTLMQRPKIEWLCYGQRSTYQCEKQLIMNN